MTSTDPIPSDLPEKAVALAAQILQEADEFSTPSERRQMAKLAAMMQDQEGKKFTIEFVDQVFRPVSAKQSAASLRDLLGRYGTPGYFSHVERLLLRTGSFFAHVFPRLVMPLMTAYVRHDHRKIIRPGEPRPLRRFLRKRQELGFLINLNRLGEAILGDEEAQRRLDVNLALLEDPWVDYISVKVSALVSQRPLVAYRQTLAESKEKLRVLYRTALKLSKFVNLDMEEYHDLDLTIDAFRELLDEPEFSELEAGIVLQAYLPDTFSKQQELTAWAKSRHARTGSSIKIRVVKGANLAMERVEAESHGWPQAPYTSKVETDANFKRMIEFGCRPENAVAVRLGIASHNLFDLAYALLLRDHFGVAERVSFEMLEGMANAQAASIHKRVGDLLVYTPIVRRENFKNAIAYLVRRLDENTDPGNFLHDIFELKVGSEPWNRQQARFLEACQLATDPTLPSTARRHQDRALETNTTPIDSAFTNAANTDFSLSSNREWIDSMFNHWRDRSIPTIPLQINGREIEGPTLIAATDPSRPNAIPYHYSIGDRSHIDDAVESAREAQSDWEESGIDARRTILLKAAQVMRRSRGDTIGCMLLDAGKAATEADAEVSEAIDFADYYARALDEPGLTDGTTSSPVGVVLVTSPWNFPYAIPAGGCLAALMAGNSVILKPAPETVLTAWFLTKQLWAAGIPKQVLQFLPVADDETGQSLVTHPKVNTVVLTGAYETAQMFRRWKPDIRLLAETSGKNCMIITASADLDLAVGDLLASAFGHSGQKCSAVSLALIEGEVYEHPQFRRQLRDAASSLHVGSAWNPTNVLTPLIRPPDESLHRALTQLDRGEEWLLQPECLEDNPCLWSPGVKLGVQPGSWFHQTECFGPVLGIIPIKDLEDGLSIQNATDFGLTGALHSLNQHEIAYWLERVQVGNAYVNRTSTGAIVRRQPFGGWKHSSVGPGAKAGGPNYVSMFRHWQNNDLPQLRTPLDDGLQILFAQLSPLLATDQERQHLSISIESYVHAWESHFSKEHDPSALRCETNRFRYRPRKEVNLRLDQAHLDNLTLATLQVCFACLVAETPLRISAPTSPTWLTELSAHKTVGWRISVEGDTELISRLGKADHSSCLRMLTTAPETIQRAITIPLIDDPVLTNGRLELRHYVQEQTVSQIRHRYGNIV